MTGINKITVTDSGNYYTVAPAVTISPPGYDRAAYAYIDSSFQKFGFSSLQHSASDTSIVGTLDQDYGTKAQTFNELAFWINLDSLGPATLVWSNNFRIHMDSSGYVGITHTADSSVSDSNASTYSITHYNVNNPLTTNNWHFVHFETNNSNLRIAIDSSFDPAGTPYDMQLSVGNNFFYDSGDIIRIGNDSDNVSPTQLDRSGNVTQGANSNKSFNGHLDNFTFTSVTPKILFDNNKSTRVPDSADDYYESTTPAIIEKFDYKAAEATAVLDPTTLKIARITITNPGFGYTSAPTVTIKDNRVIDSAYDIGDNVEQTLSSGTKITGEVMRYELDSTGDTTNRYVYLGHVGADDGKYHVFSSNNTLQNTTLISLGNNKSNRGLDVLDFDEVNKISETEQNLEFTTNDIDDFLDFSENNPFGDPENQ